LLETFSATGFRNLAPQTLFFPAGVTVLLGENGAGKTNILEGIALLAGRSSFRQARLSDMVAGDSFRLQATVATEAGPERIGLSWSRGGVRHFDRGGRRCEAGGAAAVLPAVFLAPEDRALFEGSPSVRRRSLDRLAVTLFPPAHDDYARFHRSLAQRNALLAAGGGEAGTLESWTEEFLRCAEIVRQRRMAALSMWQAHFARAFAGAGTLAGLSLGYRTEVPGEDGGGYRGLYARVRRAELAHGHTLFGPQRDDLEFLRDGRPFASAASSGEIKKAAFLLRFSEGAAVAEQHGALPLYALDDFDADLSPGAAETLLSTIPEGAQTLLTTARPGAISFLPRSPERLYEVAGGRAAATSARQQLRKTG
jgi:DNA replication and repair protein RecF